VILMKKELLESEIDAYSGDVALIKFVIGKSSKNGRLANGGGTDNDEFEDVVVIFLHDESYNYTPMLNLSLFLTVNPPRLRNNFCPEEGFFYSFYYYTHVSASSLAQRSTFGQ